MNKKKPLRLCVVCGSEKPKSELVRVYRSPDGEIGIDKTGKSGGRGAYVCKEGLCIEKLKIRKQKRLDKGFKMRVSDDIYEKLSEFIKGKNEGGI
ncbi:MAG: YlxR family protein [Ruminococcus sp.]|jgi:predicted RNA-binding protein YlxR (DUF448 family)|nr:YlxR family protein [Ruminococcus sp.]